MKTPLYPSHISLNAHIVDFFGWQMPLWYDSIIQEHEAIRSKSGMFDVSHMGRILFQGKGAGTFLNHVLSTNVVKLKEWQAKYSLILNEDGGIKDDCILYKFPDKFILVVNASNREKILKHFQNNIKGFEVVMKDITKALSLIAFQGVNAESILSKFTDIDLTNLKYYWFTQGKFNAISKGHGAKEYNAVIARTGYTGEDGFELFINSKDAIDCWDTLLEFTTPCGLGSRNSLRLEAGMPLYGNELTEQTNPFEVNLKFAVSMKKDSFIGKKALESKKVTKTIKGVASTTNKIPRDGNDLFDETGNKVGVITSGTYSPTFKKGIGICIVDNSHSNSGNLHFKHKDENCPVRLIDLPFYTNTKKNQLNRINELKD